MKFKIFPTIFSNKYYYNFYMIRLLYEPLFLQLQHAIQHNDQLAEKRLGLTGCMHWLRACSTIIPMEIMVLKLHIFPFNSIYCNCTHRKASLNWKFWIYEWHTTKQLYEAYSLDKN